MPTAEFKYTPIQSRAVQSRAVQSWAVHQDLEQELTALAPDTLSSGDLDTKRGGFSVAGMDLSIGLQLTTQIAGLMQVVTNLGMNNAGQWVLVATRTQTFPTAGTLTASGPNAPLVTPNTQNQFVVVAQPQSGGPHTVGSPSGGPTTLVAGDPATTPITPKTSGSGSPKPLLTGPTSFTVVAGDPATTQVIQQLAKNSISTVILNTTNNAIVNQQSVLNVTINNAAAIASMVGAITAANRIGAQVTHR